MNYHSKQQLILLKTHDKKNKYTWSSIKNRIVDNNNIGTVSRNSMVVKV